MSASPRAKLREILSLLRDLDDTQLRLIF
jgi:hypothetical protein